MRKNFMPAEKTIPMKHIALFNLSLALMIAILAQPAFSESKDPDNNNPKVRNQLLREASTAWSQKQFKTAANYYVYAIKNWQKPDQARDLSIACKKFFALLYQNDRHEKDKAFLNQCPQHIIVPYYSTDDRTYMPILKYAPLYPHKAIDKNLEGYVIIQYDIAKNGRTKNITVIESTDRIFEKSAKNSVKHYLYLPRIENGKPIESNGVTAKITFNLEQPKAPNNPQPKE